MPRLAVGLEDFDREGLVRRRVERAFDFRRCLAALRQGDNWVVLEGVRARIRVNVVVRGDAVLPQIDPEPVVLEHPVFGHQSARVRVGDRDAAGRSVGDDVAGQLVRAVSGKQHREESSSVVFGRGDLPSRSVPM